MLGLCKTSEPLKEATDCCGNDANNSADEQSRLRIPTSVDSHIPNSQICKRMDMTKFW